MSFWGNVEIELSSLLFLHTEEEIITLQFYIHYIVSCCCLLFSSTHILERGKDYVDQKVFQYKHVYLCNIDSNNLNISFLSSIPLCLNLATHIEAEYLYQTLHGMIAQKQLENPSDT